MNNKQKSQTDSFYSIASQLRKISEEKKLPMTEEESYSATQNLIDYYQLVLDDEMEKIQEKELEAVRKQRIETMKLENNKLYNSQKK